MARILVAEDDVVMCKFLTGALERAGHSVTTTHDGLEALAALEGQEGFDLLLSDIVMPGMDGIELSRRASRLRPGLKIMFITGFAAVTAEEGKTRIENANILSKPFHLKDLVDQIERLIHLP